MDVLSSLLSGVLAGLALAVPLGAIGVLLIQEGITRGLRRGLPGAAAVATVDILYCTASVAVGTLVGPIVGAWAPWPQIIGGSALVAIGLHGLLRSRRTGPGVDPALSHSGTSRRRYALFLGLTALNPATLVYFSAVLTGLGRIAESPLSAIAFITGVGVASLAWQALLVALGAGLRHTTGHRFQSWTSALGNGLVALLGAVLLAQAL